MTEKPLHEKKISEVINDFACYCEEQGGETKERFLNFENKLKQWSIAVVKSLPCPGVDAPITGPWKHEDGGVRKFLIDRFELTEEDLK